MISTTVFLRKIRTHLNLLSICPGEMSKRIGGNIGCKDKNYSWGFKRVPQCWQHRIDRVNSIIRGVTHRYSYTVYLHDRHAGTPKHRQKHTLDSVLSYVCVCVFSSHPFWTSSSLDVPAGVTQEEGHTGFLIHLPSAVRALIFVARRIQPFLSLVDREVEFCVLTN